jgi:DNA-binding transcriptional LysR family regulator
MRKQLQSLDLRHLAVLDQLLKECSVTKVAIKLNQRQPAVSRMLRRLHSMFGDELLVSSGSKLVPTERALALRQPLREIMAQLHRIEVAATFDPAVSDHEFRIACADCIEPSLLPKIIAKIVDAGARIRIKLRLIDPAYDVSRAFEEGELDLAIDNSPNPRDDLRIGGLYSDDVVCVMRADHPLASTPRISLAQYLAVAHLAPHPSSRHLGVIDGELAKAGCKRRVAATVPEFNMAPYVLTRTDLIFTTGRRFAEHYAQLLPLQIVLAPAEFPPIRFYQLWHERGHHSASNRWLRQQVLRTVRQRDLPAQQGERSLLELASAGR